MPDSHGEVTILRKMKLGEKTLAVDEISTWLAKTAPQWAHISELRYFVGLSVDQTAEAKSISLRTVKRDRAVAKGWLKGQMEPKV